jgi:hypothetical protein
MSAVKEQFSIHPRVSNGRTVHAKSNTSKKKRKSSVQCVINAITAHLEHHPRDSQSQNRMSNLKQALGNAVD